MDEEKKMDFTISLDDDDDADNREFERSLEDLRPDGDDSFETTVKRNLKKHFGACGSARSAAENALGFVPIVKWLPRYSFSENFIYDVMGGITTGVMHLPQGIAYAILSGVHPIYGLYSSFFPPLFYMLFGTSRHVSIGSFSVVALMTGIVNDKLQTQYAAMDEPLQLTGIEVVTTLTFTMGLCQLLTALFRLEFLTVYFSDALVAGFTTAAALHVFAAQVDDILGITLPKSAGPGYLFTRVFDTLVRVPDTNVVTLALSVAAMLILYFGKEFFSPLVNRLLPVRIPIPYELIVTVVATVVCSSFHLDTAYNVPIVGEIPTGLAPPMLPRMDIIVDCLTNSIGIAIVTIAIHISMAKMLAKKKNYEIDDSQELYALSFTSIFSSFFSVYPMSTALGRTMVMVESGTRTQLSSIFSSALVLVVILWLGPLFRTLPMCLLASVIIMALRSMFLKFSDLPRLWRISKYDFFIWVVSFSATAFIDVMEGLFVSIVFAILTVVFRTQWPRWHVFAASATTHNVCVFRFESPLLFTNVENFKKSFRKAIATWKMKNTERQIEYFVFDCSAIAYVDVMGATALQETAEELVGTDVAVFVAGAKVCVKELLGASGFFKTISTDFFLPSVGAVVDGIKLQKKLAGALHENGTPSPIGETDDLVTTV